jgi:HlyD family secretion protein
VTIAPRFVCLIVLFDACSSAAPVPVYQAVPVTKRDITVQAQASGVINPDTTVQVKSKASGEILDIKVQTGDVVKHGALIVQVDQRIPANDVATAQATLQVDSAQLVNAHTQLKRQQDLFDSRAVTAQDLEASKLAVAVANAAVVRDNITLANARIELGDTQVLSPINGTVISLAVQRGTVISSPTSSASGGTVILTMADLSLMHVLMQVDETDVGKLHPGQSADISVAAFANRLFKGTVLKIEPQADTIQSVTMFPVDIRIDNKDNLLRPGMNADVSIGVGQRLAVLAVPNAALRTEKDVASAGSVLGIAPADLQQMLTDARKTFADQSAAKSDTSAGSALPPATESPAGADTSHKGRGSKGDSTGGGGRNSGTGNNANNGTAAGAAVSAGGRGGRGGGGGGRARGDYSAGGRYIVFAKRSGRAMPVYIQTGLTDLDNAEVKIGLVEGDSVLLLPSASLVQQQAQMQARMSANSGLPGQTKPAAGTTAGAPAATTPATGGTRGTKGP